MTIFQLLVTFAVEIT